MRLVRLVRAVGVGWAGAGVAGWTGSVGRVLALAKPCCGLATLQFIILVGGTESFESSDVIGQLVIGPN